MSDLLRSARAGGARLLALLVLAAVFTAGALGGAALSRVASASDEMAPPEPRRLHRHGPAAVFAPDGPLGERLELTAEQRRQVEEILTEHGRDAEEVLQEMRPRLQAIYERTTESIRGVLDPAQQGELDAYLEERREKLRRRYGEKGEPRLRRGSPPGEEAPDGQ
jgi:Spy/CpxP family protein refolding chaperone